MVRTYEPAEPLDRHLINLLRERDGQHTAVAVRGGRVLDVVNIAWGYDEADAYAHVTTNISPSVDGTSIATFSTEDVEFVQDGAGIVLYQRQ